MKNTTSKKPTVYLVGFEANCRQCPLMIQASSDRYDEYALALDAHEAQHLNRHVMVGRDILSHVAIERSWFKRSSRRP